MVGITRHADLEATTSNFKYRPKKEDKHHTNFRDDPLAYRILQSIICGNLWAADRRHAAGQIDSDLCSWCGKRETMDHIFGNPHTTQPYEIHT